jgi:tetratricopeptide (TPR) repeat protein
MRLTLFLVGLMLSWSFWLVADDQFNKARILVRQGSLDRALPYYVKYLDTNAGAVNFHIALLEATDTLDSVSGKIAFLHRYLNQLTSPIARQMIFTFLGQMYELKNDFKNAVFCYVQAWQFSRPMQPALALQAAMIQLELGEHQRAISMVNGVFNKNLQGAERELALVIYLIAFQFLDQRDHLDALFIREESFITGQIGASLLYFLYKYYMVQQPFMAENTLKRLKFFYPQSPEVKLLENTVRLFPTPAVLW